MHVTSDNFCGEALGFVVSLALARVSEVSKDPPQTKCTPPGLSLQEAVRQGLETVLARPWVQTGSAGTAGGLPASRAHTSMGALLCLETLAGLEGAQPCPALLRYTQHIVHCPAVLGSKGLHGMRNGNTAIKGSYSLLVSA